MEQKKILFLGPADSPVLTWLQNHGERVFQASERITAEYIDREGFSFLISYGYRYILRKEILDKFSNKAINLHISYLPWNRGADPNFWSFIDDTPKGVTIHYLDEGVDTGEIIDQKEIEFNSDHETLATSYEKLQLAVQELFKQRWNEIKSGTCGRIKQAGNGSSHRVKDKELLTHILTDGWDTPLTVLEECAAETQMSTQFWRQYDSEIAEIGRQKKG